MASRCAGRSGPGSITATVRSRAHDVGPRAGEGEGTRIVRDHPAHQRREPVGPAIGEVHVAHEGDHRRIPRNDPAGPSLAERSPKRREKRRRMAWDWLIFVSKRLQRAAVAVLCIMTAQALARSRRRTPPRPAPRPAPAKWCGYTSQIDPALARGGVGAGVRGGARGRTREADRFPGQGNDGDRGGVWALTSAHDDAGRAEGDRVPPIPPLPGRRALSPRGRR